jgi:hypothetical protein
MFDEMSMPACPNPAHAGSRVVRAGLYGRTAQRRQRFRCTPLNGAPAHRFVPALPRQPAAASHCSDCSAQLDPWEGQAGARTYVYDARTIAHALVQVAEGASYKRASVTARRARRAGRPLRQWERSGQLVANWVDVFAPLVSWPDEHYAWPDALVVDSKRFQVGSGPPQPCWHVLLAAGSQDLQPGTEAWTMLPSPYLNMHAWERFVSHLQGQPRLVVADMDPSIRAAVNTVWPTTRFYWCEHHVRQRLAHAVGRLPDTHPVRADLLDRAFYSLGDWDAFVDVVRHEHGHGTHLPLAARFIRVNGPQVREQIDQREHGDPRSNSAAEAMAAELGRVLPRKRANRMSNLYRTTNLIRLLSAAQRGRADEVAWAVRIRRYLESYGGRMPLHQRPHVDPAGHPSLYL